MLSLHSETCLTDDHPVVFVHFHFQLDLIEVEVKPQIETTF